jgi:hypothetical protein
MKQLIDFNVFLLKLDLIIELLGSPSLEEMRSACEGAKTHVLRSAHRPPSLAALYTLSSQATHEAVHLLCRMLVFDPVSKLAVHVMFTVINRVGTKLENFHSCYFIYLQIRLSGTCWKF